MKQLIFVAFVLMIFVRNCSDPQFTKEEIVGVYINNYHDRTILTMGVPDKKDTLILYDDMRFESGFYGGGSISLIISAIR